MIDLNKPVVGWLATVLVLAVTVAGIVATVADWTVDVPVRVLEAGTTFLIPLGVGAVTKFIAPSQLRAALLAVLAVAAVVLTNAVAAGGHLDADNLFVQSVIVFAGAFGIHKGLLEPTGVAPAVRTATGRVGLGKTTARNRPLPAEWKAKAGAHADGDTSTASLDAVTVDDEVPPFSE